MTIYFNLPSKDLIELEGAYSLELVLLSVLVACIASYAALTINKQAHENSFFHRNVWFSISSIIMSFGIWSMHFIGMDAYILPTMMGYNQTLTIVSIIPAMLSTFFAFYIVNSPKRTVKSYVIGGLIMGTGISSMHYIGMAAMRMDALAVYHKGIFATSIGIAIVVSFIALSIFSTMQEYMKNYGIKTITALMLGLAVSSMHYTGMMAVTFYDAPIHSGTPHTGDNINMSIIITSIAVGMIILLLLILLSTLTDQYIKYRTKYYDPLTRLPNQRLFEKKLAQSASERTVAIWHIHRLEKINREFGYTFGDEVIQKTATVLLAHKPMSVELFRIDGNRFAFLVNGASGNLFLQPALKNISTVLQQPIVFSSRELLLSAVCAWHHANNAQDMNQLYNNVLAVLNHPKIQYQNEIIFYESKIHTYTFEQEILSDVERAMLEDELYLVYQPKIHGKTYEIFGVETLLRWNHPKHGLLSPAVFIPILEANNKILDVTDWVIEKTCQQMTEWNRENSPIKQVAINIPGPYVTSSRLLKVLKQSVSKNNLQSNCIELEITETSLIQSIDEAVNAVATLRDEGFSVALDDFGTGVSSLSYLRKIPISTLKIDKSFIDGIPASKKDSLIIQAIIAIGTSLSLSIVFEGIETFEQVDFLENACDDPILQGFYFAKPMTAYELTRWYSTFSKKM